MSLTKFNPRIGENLLEVVSSVEELKSLKHLKHAVLVLGAVDKEDGDGGIYIWDASNNEQSDDISIIRSNGNDVGRWKRLSYALNSSVDAPLNFEAESSKTVSFQQQNYSFGVASRFNVTATSNVEWLTIGNIDRDDLSHTLNYSVTQNLSSSSREGVITIKNGFNTFTYVVTQSEVETVSGPAQLVYANQARNNNIATITSNASWSASASDSWITLISSSGNGNGSIQFDLTENNNQFADRVGTITVTTSSGYASHVITIAQSQAASIINDVVDQNISSDASNSESFTVNSDIGWTATTNTDWITITTGTGNDGDNVVYSVTQNTDTENDRTGSITLTSDNNTNVVTVNIIQSKLASGFIVKIDTTLVDSNEFLITNARNITIDWGDGSPTSSSTDESTISTFNHTYATEGEYNVTISQNSEGCNFRLGTTGALEYPKMVKEILDWGNIKIDSLLEFMANCQNLTTLSSDVSNFDTSGVTDMKFAWYWCFSLTGTFPLINTINVTDMKFAWTRCESLTSFPLINTSNVTDMYGTWSRCYSLTSFPPIVTSNVTDMSYTWDVCYGLTGEFPLIDTSSVTNMYSTWNNCYSLTGAFPEIVTSNVTNMSRTWYHCNGLTSFPLIDTRNVTDMSNTWVNCYGLTSFPPIVTSNVINMSSAWAGCTYLTSFPPIVTSNVTNMSNTWQACLRLESFPSIDTSSVTNMSTTWRYCSSLTEFPSIDVSANTDFSRTWEFCNSLTTFNPFTNTTYTSAQWDETWKDCPNLTFTSNANSPFANIGSNTLPVSINTKLLVYRPGYAESTYQNLGLYDPLPDGSTYYPPFDVSGVNAIYIDDSGTTITDFNIIGWDQMTFARVNYGADPNPTVEIDINATLANTEVDNILNQLYSNLSNHTPLEGTSTYSMNFHSNGRTTSSDTAANGLLAAGWNITLNNILQIGPTQLGLDVFGEAVGDAAWAATYGTAYSYSISMNSTGDRVAIGAEYNDGNGNQSGHTRIYEWRQYTSNDVGLYNYESRLQNGTQTKPVIITENFTTAPVINQYYWTQMGIDIDGEYGPSDNLDYGDRSGHSVSMNAEGNRVAITAQSNPVGGASEDFLRGHTRIYEYSNGTWSQLGQDIEGEVAGDRSGHSVSMNDVGNRVAIGAAFNEGNGNNSGHTRIYEYNNGTWSQLGSDIDGEVADDWSGYSVSMNSTGDRVAIGAPYNDGSGSSSGHARIYEWRQYTANDVNLYNHTSRLQNGTQTKPVIITENFNTAPVINQYYWTQMGSDINGEAANDNSGWSVSINAEGNRVAIGASGNDGNGADSGHTRIYEYSNGTWSQLGQDIDGEAANDYGSSVSINAEGNRVAIGAIGNDDNGTDSGHIRIYEYINGTWTKMGIDIDGEAANDYSGWTVSMNDAGNRVAIGAPATPTTLPYVKVYQI